MDESRDEGQFCSEKVGFAGAGREGVEYYGWGLVGGFVVLRGEGCEMLDEENFQELGLAVSVMVGEMVCCWVTGQE